MPVIRTSSKLREKDSAAKQRISRRRGPKPKPLEQRTPNLQIKPVQRVQRSYSRLKKIQVLMWIKYHRVPNETCNTAIKMRPPTSCDHELKIKGFAPDELVIGDWARSEEETGYGTTENENSELPRSKNLHFQLRDEPELPLGIQSESERCVREDLGEGSGKDSPSGGN